MKNDVNVPYLQKVIRRKTFVTKLGILKVSDESRRIRIRIHESEAWIRGSGSTPKCHGFATLLKLEIIFAGYSSPRHSSEFSTASHHSNAGVEDNSPASFTAVAAAAAVNNSVGKRHIGSMEDEEIPEEVIQFVSENPRIMRRWQSLAHQVTCCLNCQYLALCMCQLMEVCGGEGSVL
jgi:hypothetical protein